MNFIRNNSVFNWLRNRRGVSLFIAILFTMALMLSSASLAHVIISGEQMQQRWIKHDQMKNMLYSAENIARYMATYGIPEGGDESEISADFMRPLLAALERSAASMGLDAQDIANCTDVDGIAANGLQPCFELKVNGRGMDNSSKFDFKDRLGDRGLYSVPIKGTGSALGVIGNNSAAGDGSARCVDINNVDDPCNWNRLAFGDSVEIPLYYETRDPVRPNDPPILHVPDLRRQSGGAMYLRMRTPCREDAPSANQDALLEAQRRWPGAGIDTVEKALRGLGYMDAKVSGTEYPRNCTEADERIILYPKIGTPDYLSFTKDPVIVQWLIKGVGLEELVAREGRRVVNGSKWRWDFDSPRFLDNSQLTNGRINGANHNEDFVVLSMDDEGAPVLHSLDDPPAHENIASYIFDNTAKKPSLKLNAITKLRKDDGHGVETQRMAEYLEYQLLTSEPVSEFETKYEVTVRLFGLEARKMGKIRRRMSGNDFVLGNL